MQVTEAKRTRVAALARAGWLPAALIAGCFLLQVADLEQALRFDRERIIEGAWWRMLSANFIHLGWNHYVLNMVGAALVFALFGASVSAREWLGVIVITSVAIALTVLALNENINWYVGLSGTLHGMFTYGAVAELRHARLFASLLLLGAGAKLLWEQIVGSLPGTAETVGGEVIVDAHLYGALAGLFLAICWRAYCAICQHDKAP
jgi:rhomboid family GlyGly-CTERM serine protease